MLYDISQKAGVKEAHRMYMLVVCGVMLGLYLEYPPLTKPPLLPLPLPWGSPVLGACMNLALNCRYCNLEMALSE